MIDKEYLLFDLDGTLTDSREGIINSIKYALNTMNFPIPDEYTLQKFLGPPLLFSFAEYSGMDKEQAKEALGFYREYFTSKGMFENTPYEGVKELLLFAREKGKKVVLATSKPEKFSRTILEYFGMDKCFDFICGATMDEKRTSKQQVISYILEMLEISPFDAVMIGDRELDIIGAKLCGVENIGVLYGYGSREELEKAGADRIAETVEDLGRLIFE